jgi:hypothetical protein
LGKDNTIRLTLALAKSVLLVTWAFYGIALFGGQSISPFTTVMTSIIASVVVITLGRMREGLNDAEFMRKQHGKLFPLQMLMHPSLIVGVMIL